MKASILSVVCVSFYFFCLEVEISDGEFSANLLFLIVFFHVVLLFITLLICLWQGGDVVGCDLYGSDYCIHVFIVFYSSAFHYKKEFLVRL